MELNVYCIVILMGVLVEFEIGVGFVNLLISMLMLEFFVVLIWWFNDDNCYEILGRRYVLFPLEKEVGLAM
jgi:hypothetical protein